MMLTVFTIIGWALVLLFGAAFVSVLTQLPKGWRDIGLWVSAALWASLFLACMAGLGAIPLIPSAPLAVLLFLVAAIPGLTLTRPRMSGRDVAKVGLGYLRRDVRGLAKLTRGPKPRVHGKPASAPQPAAPQPTAPQPTAPPESQRPVPAPPANVPSLRDDPVIGQAPDPVEVAAGLQAMGAAVPPEWAALCQYIADFEPDTDDDLIEHTAGDAAGILAAAAAMRARADNLLHGTGLDPAYVAGHHEFADEFADLAAAVALVDKRFHAIYGALRAWVDEHPEGMPHRAREFLQGGDPETGVDDGDIAA